MEIIASTNRHQIAFSSLEDVIEQDNVVRVIEAFVEHIDLTYTNWVTMLMFALGVKQEG